MQTTKHIKKYLKVKLCKNNVLSSPACHQTIQDTFFFSKTKLLGDWIISSWKVKMKNNQTKLTLENVELFRNPRFLETYRGTEIPKIRKIKGNQKKTLIYSVEVHASLQCFLFESTDFLFTCTTMISVLSSGC